MEFSVSMDEPSMMMTGFAFFIVIGIFIYKKLGGPINGPEWLFKIVMVFIAGVFIYSYNEKPLNLNITDKALIINRLVGDIVIKRDDILTVEEAALSDMEKSDRVFGNGGVFGYYGHFWNKKYGDMTFHATRWSRFVVVTTKDSTKYVVTPDEPYRFVSFFKTQ